MKKEDSYLAILKENQKKEARSFSDKNPKRQMRKQPAHGLPDPEPIKEAEEPAPIEAAFEKEPDEPELSEEFVQIIEEPLPVLAKEEKTDPLPEEPIVKPLPGNPQLRELGKPVDPETAKKKMRRATILIREGEELPDEPVPQPTESPKEIRISVGESCEIVLSINVSVVEKRTGV